MTRILLMSLIVGTLAACASAPVQGPAAPTAPTASASASSAAAATPAPSATAATPAPAAPLAVSKSAAAHAALPAGSRADEVPGALPPDTAPLGAPIVQAKSRWVPVRWAELPGFADDRLHDAWNAWLKSCERPAPPWGALCADVRRLSIADESAQRAWMLERLQPYRVEPLAGASAAAPAGAGAAEGLLTGYYEPVLSASRQPTASHSAALYKMPADLASKKPWFTRQEIDTLPQARAALQGRAIAYLADPVDVLILQIQGSGRLRIGEANGSQKTVRVAYAGTNDQPYKSVGRWLLDQGAIKDATWPGIKAWIAANPQRVNDMLWSNPRVVFFKEEPLSDADASSGPRGAQGVALTAGRSIAVDPQSLPYGSPVWLASSGPQLSLQRLVFAQDTGGAIVGAVRADFYVGSGNEAGEVAGRLKQPLKMWVLWPKPSGL